MKFSNNTAVLLFANSSQEELLHKPMPKGALLFDALTRETISKVEKTGLPYFHITEKDQNGSSFGERFSNAIQHVYDQGYENVIAIGNDSPQLKSSHIKQSAKQLTLGKTVLGPSKDGGFYLLGIRKSDFDRNIFQKLPWQRFGLLERISKWFQTESLEVFRLPILLDLDSDKDLKTFANCAHSLSTFIFTIILDLLKQKNNILFYEIDYKKNPFLRLPHNKGSPLPLSA